MSTGANENPSIIPKEIIGNAEKKFEVAENSVNDDHVKYTRYTNYPEQQGPISEARNDETDLYYTGSFNNTNSTNSSYEQSATYHSQNYSGYANYSTHFVDSQKSKLTDSQGYNINFSNNLPPTSISSVDFELKQKTSQPPGSGWKRVIYELSGHKINLGKSKHDEYDDRLTEIINSPVGKSYKIAVFALKGGVGKTTTTVGLGIIFASLRKDRVIAVDINPDLGTLPQRVELETHATIRDLLQDPHIERYQDVRTYTTLTRSNLEILSSERDPENAIEFSTNDYEKTLQTLERFYKIIISDCGTGITHPSTYSALEKADTLILTTTPTIDGGKSALSALEWLENHGHESLVKNTIVVVCSLNYGAASINIEEMKRQFLKKVRAVHLLPHDHHLAEGGHIDLAFISPSSHRAFKELAALIAENFN